MSSSANNDIYNNGTVSITKTLVKVGKITYPVNGIGSVFIYQPSSIALYAIAAVCGAFAFNDQNSNPDAVGPLLLIAAVLIGVALLRKSSLKIRTASGDQQLLTSRNTKYLETIKSAIEDAVTQRG